MSDKTATVKLLDEDAGNLYGMYRTLLSNMVSGVGEGFSRVLEIVGVGYKAEVKAGSLQLALGYSHPVVFPLPEGVTAAVEANTVIKLSGMDKARVGQPAARIRMLRQPDAYKNKGIPLPRERLIKKGRQGGGQVTGNAQPLKTGI